MPRAGELTYYDAIGEDGRQHALRKPFSEPDCAYHLLNIGALMALLPPPPGRVLECGCGPGWLASLLQRRGYDVVGLDVSPQAIEMARLYPPFRDGPVPTFEVGDSEHMEYDGEFDAVLFHDSLHHCVDEVKALASACRALRPGGVCVTSEPGRGHHARSQGVIANHDVTEKDMPADHIVRVGKQVGFRSAKVYPRLDEAGQYLYGAPVEGASTLKRLLRCWPLNYLVVGYKLTLQKNDRGLVVLTR